MINPLCRMCGTIVSEDMEFCPKCGQKLTYENVVFPIPPPPPPTPVSTIQIKHVQKLRPKHHYGRIISSIIILLVLVLFAFEGFSEYAAVNSMSESLTGIGVQNIGFTSATVVFTINFINPSSGSTPTFSANFDVYLAGTYIGSGSLPSTSVAGGSSTLQTLSFTVSYLDVGSAVIQALISGSTQLTVSGTVHSQILFGIIPVSFPFSSVYG